MRLCIQRGAREIGGSCVEVEHDGARLVLDAGLPLDGALGDEHPPPAVSGLTEGDSSIVGLLVSHGHPDHYSGDLRAHGRKAALFERLLHQPPPHVDVLLLEGTNIREVPGPSGLSERDVEERSVELFKQAPGMVLACYSPQNIDRLVTLFRAAKRSGRTLVMDLYAATMAQATGRETIPQADWDGVRVFIPLSQRIKVKQAEEFERVAWLRGQRLFPEDLAGRAGELVMTFRGSMASELGRAGCLDGAHAMWSMWSGYLDEPSGAKLRAWLEDRGIGLTIVHSSGHASTADLQRFASAINAKEVVPVHTRQPGRYGELFSNVRQHADGEWWKV